MLGIGERDKTTSYDLMILQQNVAALCESLKIVTEAVNKDRSDNYSRWAQLRNNFSTLMDHFGLEKKSVPAHSKLIKKGKK